MYNNAKIFLKNNILTDRPTCRIRNDILDLYELLGDCFGLNHRRYCSNIDRLNLLNTPDICIKTSEAFGV